MFMLEVNFCMCFKLTVYLKTSINDPGKGGFDALCQHR